MPFDLFRLVMGYVNVITRLGRLVIHHNRYTGMARLPRVQGESDTLNGG